MAGGVALDCQFPSDRMDGEKVAKNLKTGAGTSVAHLDNYISRSYITPVVIYTATCSDVKQMLKANRM